MKKPVITYAISFSIMITALLGGYQTIQKINKNSEISTDCQKNFSLEKISDLEFYFHDIGGDGTTHLRVRTNGTFYGDYMSYDEQNKGEQYPNGTQHYCKFIGKLSAPKKVNEFIYSSLILNIRTETEDNTEKVKDNIRYIYIENIPGLENAKNILFYLPGTPIKKLPKEFMDTVKFSKNIDGADPFYGLNYETSHTPKTLYFFGLFNEENGSGFRGEQHAGYYAISFELEQLEEKAEEIKQMFAETTTLYKKKQLSKKLYALWDNERKSIWKLIEEYRDSELIDQLKKEERQWILEKEDALKKVKTSSEDEKQTTILENLKAAELTKKRVEKLAYWLNQ